MFFRIVGSSQRCFGRAKEARRAAQTSAAVAAMVREVPPVPIHMAIEPARGLVCRPGEFGAEVTDDVLLLPEAVAKSFKALGARDAIDALAYLDAFPTAVANELQWKVSEVMHAADRLRVQLRGRVADELLAPAEPTTRVYGAIKP